MSAAPAPGVPAASSGPRRRRPRQQETILAYRSSSAGRRLGRRVQRHGHPVGGGSPPPPVIHADNEVDALGRLASRRSPQGRGDRHRCERRLRPLRTADNDGGHHLGSQRLDHGDDRTLVKPLGGYGARLSHRQVRCRPADRLPPAGCSSGSGGRRTGSVATSVPYFMKFVALPGSPVYPYTSRRATSAGTEPSWFLSGTRISRWTREPTRFATSVSMRAGSATSGARGGPFFPHAGSSASTRLPRASAGRSDSRLGELTNRRCSQDVAREGPRSSRCPRACGQRRPRQW